MRCNEAITFSRTNMARVSWSKLMCLVIPAKDWIWGTRSQCRHIYNHDHQSHSQCHHIYKHDYQSHHHHLVQNQVGEWVSEMILADAHGGMRLLFHPSGESTRWRWWWWVLPGWNYHNSQIHICWKPWWLGLTRTPTLSCLRWWRRRTNHTLLMHSPISCSPGESFFVYLNICISVFVFIGHTLFISCCSVLLSTNGAGWDQTYYFDSQTFFVRAKRAFGKGGSRPGSGGEKVKAKLKSQITNSNFKYLWWKIWCWKIFPLNKKPQIPSKHFHRRRILCLCRRQMALGEHRPISSSSPSSSSPPSYHHHHHITIIIVVMAMVMVTPRAVKC